MVSPFFNAGMVAYEFDIVLNAWLLATAWRRGLRRCFFWYTLARLIRDVILFPLFVAAGMEAYSRMYWLTNPIYLAFLLMALCEIVSIRKTLTVAAVAVAAFQFALVIPRNNWAIQVELAVEAFVAAVAGYALYWNFIAIGKDLREELASPWPGRFMIAGKYMREAYVAARERWRAEHPLNPAPKLDTLSLGLFIGTFIPAFCRWYNFLLHANISRFIPSYAFLVAQILWLVWAYRVTEDTVVPFAD